MKLFYLFTVISLMACNETEQHNTSFSKADSVQYTPDTASSKTESAFKKESQPYSSQQDKTYSNARFKDVTVVKSGTNKFIVQGRAQVFEAHFSWVVEDGHNELKKGHDVTDAGAPEWGKFHFTIEAQKERQNSTLTLILFEASAKDGSRQHELPIVLD